MKSRVNAGISYSQSFLELTACIKSNLDPDKWDKGEYSSSLKAKVIARYELAQLIAAHVEDARIDKQKADSQRKRKR